MGAVGAIAYGLQLSGGRQELGAAAILVLAAFGVLVAVRVLHWGRVLDLRSIG